jgi:hypothetical protein
MKIIPLPEDEGNALHAKEDSQPMKKWKNALYW